MRRPEISPGVTRTKWRLSPPTQGSSASCDKRNASLSSVTSLIVPVTSTLQPEVRLAVELVDLERNHYARGPRGGQDRSGAGADDDRAPVQREVDGYDHRECLLGQCESSDLGGLEQPEALVTR